MYFASGTNQTVVFLESLGGGVFSDGVYQFKLSSKTYSTQRSIVVAN